VTQGPKTTELIQMVNVENLLLDYENPRLTTAGVEASQEALLKELYNRYDLDDLIVSLARNGYFSEEPLIAVQHKGGAAKLFTVVEGNRRLAALKILLSEDAQKTVGAKNVPKPLPEVVGRLNPVPIKVYPSRAEIVPYLGVRHIVGVKPWDALAKAKYIERLVSAGYSIGQVKEKVGIQRGDVVQRWLLTFYLLNQANSIADEPWHTAREDFNFSFLYTSVGYQSIREYLEMDAGILASPHPDPVPKKARKKLLDHMWDLYGAPDRPELRKVRESREIRQLAAVYETPEALGVLRAGAPLPEAYRRSIGEAAEMVELVRNASYQLDQANALAPHHRKNPEARKFAKRCLDSAQHLYQTLED